MDIKQIKTGRVNDDFIHDRLTLKVILENENFMLFKLYRIKQELKTYYEDEMGYFEKDVAEEVKDKIFKFIAENKKHTDI